MRIVPRNEELVAEAGEAGVLHRRHHLQLQVAHRTVHRLYFGSNRASIARNGYEGEAAVGPPPMQVGDEALAGAVEASQEHGPLRSRQLQAGLGLKDRFHLSLVCLARDLATVR